MDNLPRPVDWSVTLYRILVNAYPASFQKAFREEIVVVFRELAIDGWTRNGLSGLIAVWCRVVADLCISLPQQYCSLNDGRICSMRAIASNYKSFRMTMGHPNPNGRWTHWRILAVGVTSLLTLLIGAAVFSLTQAVVMQVCSLILNALGIRSIDFPTIILISTVVALIADVWIVWLGASLITRFSTPSSHAERIADGIS